MTPAARVAHDEAPFGSLVAIPERYSIGSGADLYLRSYSEHIFCTVVSDAIYCAHTNRRHCAVNLALGAQSEAVRSYGRSIS
jgi:hypothetical protein